jgi:hypothetical protein
MRARPPPRASARTAWPRRPPGEAAPQQITPGGADAAISDHRPGRRSLRQPLGLVMAALQRGLPWSWCRQAGGAGRRRLSQQVPAPPQFGCDGGAKEWMQVGISVEHLKLRPGHLAQSLPGEKAPIQDGVAHVDAPFSRLDHLLLSLLSVSPLSVSPTDNTPRIGGVVCRRLRQHRQPGPTRWLSELSELSQTTLGAGADAARC